MSTNLLPGRAPNTPSGRWQRADTNPRMAAAARRQPSARSGVSACSAIRSSAQAENTRPEV